MAAEWRHIRAADRPDAVRKRYLGDGVYAAVDDEGGIWLTAEDGIVAHDAIYLEPSVMRALTAFAGEDQ